MPSTTPTCPFCAIATAYPPSAPSSLNRPSPPITNPQTSPSTPSTPQTSPSPSSPAHLLLTTPTLLAFLDHAPISRGHVLLATRAHREKLSDLTVDEGRAIGAWLPLVSRAVVGTVAELQRRFDGLEGDGHGDGDTVGDWNVVQNNGARAAQVVPHVHFHIIPRVGDVPEVRARSWTVFGKGLREELDEEDAEVLVRGMRRRLEQEVRRVEEREGEVGLRGLMGGAMEKGGGWKL